MKNQRQTQKEGIKKGAPAPRETGNDSSSGDAVLYIREFDAQLEVFKKELVRRLRRP
ncbi:MAG: hypothetical protein P8012_08390 [Desulfobacterales bacterium]